MQDFHGWLERKRLARQPCRVVGDSRTGKTISCDTYHLKSRATQFPGQSPIVPVLYWQCPEGLSLSSLLVGLLDRLQYQATRGRIMDLRKRVYRVLESCQVEMIIFDEAQRASLPALGEIRDIAQELDIAAVLVGTDRLNAVVQRDEQVEYRFLATYRYPRLGAEELLETTALWEENVLKLPEPSNLTSAKAQQLLIQGTRGCIGLLDQILRDAAIQALQQGELHISLKRLKQVVKECSLVR
ncbi:MAG: AAA family ATPase [Leptolyngbya sp. SIO4C5]|uniref:TniB family NTP-binding protein n=1 Tax=Sphaerothrix gracilis TaxID=3151835 RepID=UPI0013C1DB16|nr:AAA family ATPase [Leptolyngbya sp. SIO4C5]